MGRADWWSRWGGDVAFAGLLSILAAASSAGLTGSNAGNPRSGLLAAVMVLAMVAPVLLARRFPTAVAVTIGVGALLNWLVIGHLVRCGTALPAVFYVAFVLGMRRTSWPQLALAGSALALNLVCQAYSDPALGASVLGYMVPIALGFGVAGDVWRRRRADVARLRVETARLREKRDATARMAVAADRARIAADLSGFLHDGVGRIEQTAAQGRAHVADPDVARQAFADIQQAGRTTLTRMREVLTDLGGDSPVVAGAMLAQLDRLVAQATEGRSRLRVLGDPRLLPPGLELSTYRVIERLLAATGVREPEVTVEFGSCELQLTVVGAVPDVDRATLAAARERVAVFGGTVQRSLEQGRRAMVVRLPLAAARV